jgi:DnaK suppressor protein
LLFYPLPFEYPHSLFFDAYPKPQNNYMQESQVSHRYSDHDLSEFRQLVEQKLTKARVKVAFYRQQIAELGDNADTKLRGPEDSLGGAEMERAQELAGKEVKYIQHLENALTRIDNKTYGICRETGVLIEKNRLMAVPHATLSMLAKVRQ